MTLHILCEFPPCKGVTFSEDMSDEDFKAYLEKEGVRERDFSSLVGRHKMIKIMFRWGGWQ